MRLKGQIKYLFNNWETHREAVDYAVILKATAVGQQQVLNY